MRDVKQVLSLNQIWRFLSHEIDKERLIEQKIMKMEEEEDSSADEVQAENS